MDPLGQEVLALSEAFAEELCAPPSVLWAIDVGPVVSHLVVYDYRRKKVLQVAADIQNETLVNDLALHSSRAELDGRPLPVVVETIEPRGQALGHDLVNTILWVGRFREASRGALLGRSKVCKHLVGKDRNDSAIRQVLIDKLGPPRITAVEVGPKGGRKKVSSPGPTAGVSGDLWQALALAVTYAETVLQKEEA